WAHPKDMLKEGLYYSLGGEEYSEEKCKYLIEDEERRVCLNTSDERIIENVPGLRGGDVRKIIRRRTEGSEDGEERQKQFQTIEELRYLFRNIDDTIWFGDDNAPGLRDLLTRWGNGLININTAPEEVLECIPDLRSGAVGAIMNFRAGQDGRIGTEDDKWFNDLGQVTKETGISMDALQPYCTVQSQFYTITGIATLRQGKVRASCRATVVVTEASANILQWREEPIGS
ncbi:MAG: hypothetical protein QG656_1667, partial [Candidatus Hydrogenedentes bacterium]|nr:hypothetical protein [Candidatus Hydrogenedentota bacterium]